MQTITKIPARAGTFTVKAKPSKNNQIFVSIFLNKDKIPVFGSAFSATENPASIIEWAAGKAKNYPQQTQR